MHTTTPQPAIRTAAEAFAAIALASVACDGELAAAEARALRQHLEFRQPFCRYPDGAMAELLDQLLLILRQQGCEALVAQAAPLLEPQQRQTALAVAVNLTQADHVQSLVERRFLHQLGDLLAIAPERVAVILDVIDLLNRDSLAD